MIWYLLIFFEIIIVFVFLYFVWEYVDVVVIEVGFGGWFDFINVCKLMFFVIIMIGFDYIYIFGDIRVEIVVEKVGIIKFGVFVINGEVELDLVKVIVVVVVCN